VLVPLGGPHEPLSAVTSISIFMRGSAGPISSRYVAHVRRFLHPGGRLLITTGARGGSAAMEVLNLWATMTEGCGALPEPAELERQLEQAAYTEVRRAAA
jgi:hypothetical protein